MLIHGFWSKINDDKEPKKKFGNNSVLCSLYSLYSFSKEPNTKFLFATRKDLVQHDLNLLRIINMFEIYLYSIRRFNTKFQQIEKVIGNNILHISFQDTDKRLCGTAKMISIMLICLCYAPQLSKIFVNWHQIHFPVCSSNLASVYAWKYHLHPINLAEIATTISQMPNLHHFSIDRLGIWESAHHRQCKTGSCNLRIRELTF